MFAGDDYVAVDGENEPFVHSLYQTAKVNADNMSRIGHLGLKAANADRLDKGEKAVLFPATVYPERISRGFPLRCILIPRLSGCRETRIRPARPAEALLNLAPTTLCQLPGSSPRAFDKMSALIRKLPAFHLEAGFDLAGIPAAIGGFLRKEFA
jgi:hypothetical protein